MSSETEDYGGSYQLVSEQKEMLQRNLDERNLTLKVDFFPKPKEEFHITDLSGCDFYLKVMAGYENEIKLIEKQSQEMIASIRSRMKGFAYRYKNEFEHFMVQHIATLKSGKNVKMFHGTVQMRTVPASLSRHDSEKMMLFAKDFYPDLIKMVPMLDTTAYAEMAKKSLKEEGALLPGMELKPERQSLSYPGKIEVEDGFVPEENQE